MAKKLDIKLILKTLLFLFIIIYLGYKMQTVIDPSSPDISQPLLKIPCVMKAKDNTFTRDRVVNYLKLLNKNRKTCF